MTRAIPPPIGPENASGHFSHHQWAQDEIVKSLELSGGTVTGPITLPGNPSAPLQAAPKQYVDALLPIGAVVAYGGSVAPPGWHLCDGSAHGSAALEAVLVSPNTPNLRDRFIIGAGGSVGVNVTGGNAAHSHNPDQNGWADLSWASNGDIYMRRPNVSPNWTPTLKNASAGPTLAGNSTPQNLGVELAGRTAANNDTRPPYYALTYIIRKG